MEYKQMSEGQFLDWYRDYSNKPLSVMTGRCPHCGQNNPTAIINYASIKDEGREYTLFKDCQIECRNCHSRGGLYERQLERTPARPKELQRKNLEVLTFAVGFWNRRFS